MASIKYSEYIKTANQTSNAEIIVPVYTEADNNEDCYAGVRKMSNYDRYTYRYSSEFVTEEDIKKNIAELQEMQLSWNKAHKESDYFKEFRLVTKYVDAAECWQMLNKLSKEEVQDIISLLTYKPLLYDMAAGHKKKTYMLAKNIRYRYTEAQRLVCYNIIRNMAFKYRVKFYD